VKPSPSDQFPFPGEPLSTGRGIGAAAPQIANPSTAAKQFPYPGDVSPTASLPTSPGSDTGSSSSRATGSDSPPSEGVDDAKSIRRKLPKPERIQSDEDREAEDLDVAKLYRQSGNLAAAYLRAKDAVKLQSGDAEAHFLLAEIARDSGRREEAAMEYDTYMKLDPGGDHSRFAQRALGTLRSVSRK